MAHFSFEDLEVWQKAVDFADHVLEILDALNSDRRHFRLVEQMEAAVTSIPMNIAEGKGRFSKKEFAQFLYFARGSVFEVVTLIGIFRRRNWVTGTQAESIRNDADQVGKTLSALANSLKRVQ